MLGIVLVLAAVAAAGIFGNRESVEGVGTSRGGGGRRMGMFGGRRGRMGDERRRCGPQY